jgi:hypothetical protein
MSGEDGLKVLGEEHPDLALLDVVLPGIEAYLPEEIRDYTPPEATTETPWYTDAVPRDNSSLHCENLRSATFAKCWWRLDIIKRRQPGFSASTRHR